MNNSSNWIGRNILIVDDEEANYVLASLVLKKLKSLTHWMKNGREACEFVDNNKVDIILMDIKMPVMDGYEATKIIKSKFPEIPIIMQTAFSLSTERELSFEAGCDEFFTKPIDYKKFIITMNKYL